MSETKARSSASSTCHARSTVGWHFRRSWTLRTVVVGYIMQQAWDMCGLTPSLRVSPRLCQQRFVHVELRGVWVCACDIRSKIELPVSEPVWEKREPGAIVLLGHLQSGHSVTCHARWLVAQDAEGTLHALTPVGCVRAWTEPHALFDRAAERSSCPQGARCALSGALGWGIGGIAVAESIAQYRMTSHA